MVNLMLSIDDDLPPQRVVIPYRPRPFQRQLHADATRFKVLVCHRRFGKTVYAINDLIRQIMTCPHEAPRGMYCAPWLKQAKSIAWDYLLRFSAPIPGHSVNRGELRIDYPNGGRITLAGADNIDAHRGIYLDSLVLDEFAQMSPRIWGEVFRPTLSDRKGRGVFIGTPKGRTNGFYDMYQRGKERDFQKEMRRTGYQVAVRDMRQAGLNPMMMFLCSGFRCERMISERLMLS